MQLLWQAKSWTVDQNLALELDTKITYHSKPITSHDGYRFIHKNPCEMTQQTA